MHPLITIREKLNEKPFIQMQMDEALMLASFDLKPDLLFEQHGVQCLTKNNIASNDWLRRLLAWDAYGIQHLYVCELALKRFNIDLNLCIRGLNVLNHAEKKQLILNRFKEHPVVIAKKAFDFTELLERIYPENSTLCLIGEAIDMLFSKTNADIWPCFEWILVREKSLLREMILPQNIKSLNDKDWAKQLSSAEILQW